MTTPIAQKDFVLIERTHIRSGPIVRSDDRTRQYGVIFTTTQSPVSPSPDDFLPADLLGATLTNLELVGTGEDPHFTVLGGYFCKRIGPKNNRSVEISHVFGDAADPRKGFNLSTPTNCLVDEWEMEDLTGARAKNMMNEREVGEDGWTLLVSYKPHRRLYPFSGKAMELSRDCPAIKEIITSIGKLTPKGLTVHAKVGLDGSQGNEYVWDWGDGSPPEHTQTHFASHLYERLEAAPPTYTISVEVLGPGSCKSTASLIVDAPPPPCPIISIESVKQENHAAFSDLVEIKLKVRNSTPSEYRWNWGDGSDIEITTDPTASHVFSMTSIPSPKETFQIMVEAVGPDGCSDKAGVPITVLPPPCPSYGGVELVNTTLGDSFFEVEYEAKVLAGEIESFVWDWGDGSQQEVITSTRATHRYDRPAGDGLNFSITISPSMPGHCALVHEVVEQFVPGVCPAFEAHPADSFFAIDPAGTEVPFNLIVKVKPDGPQPESYTVDWGDGSAPETFTTKELSHAYQRPADKGQTFTYKVTANGPGSNCAISFSDKVKIPGLCPVLLSFTHEILQVEVDTNGMNPAAEVRFLLTHAGPAPSQYTWDFGDGSKPFTIDGSENEARHFYALKFGEPTIAVVKVQATGPDSICHTELAIPIELEGLRCPEILDVQTVQTVNAEEGTLAVQFELNVGSRVLRTYTWDLGDGSDPVTTVEPRHSHQYQIGFGEEIRFPVTVQADGPDTCSSSAEMLVLHPPVCPIVNELTASFGEAPSEQEVLVHVELNTGIPDTYMWSWDQDQVELETTQSPQNSHVYARPIGDSELKEISVSTQGPENCGGLATVTVLIPGLCPEVTDLTLTLAEQQGEQQLVRAAVGGSVADAESYEWHWGDNSPPTTTQSPQADHTYRCLAEKEAPYPVRVIARGPGACVSELIASVIIPGCPICPELRRIDKVLTFEDDTSVTYALAPVLEKGMPDSFVWDCGDGSAPETTNDPTIYHTFSKQAEAVEYTVKLQASGPKDCQLSGEVRVGVDPATQACPELTGIRVLRSHNRNDKETEIHVTVDVKGDQPDRFTWDWVTGSAPQVTTEPTAVLVFQRPDRDRDCRITVKSSGPGQCTGETATQVPIPAVPAGPSLWCRLMAYITAFLGALALGTVVVCLAAEVFPSSAVPSGQSTLILVIMVSAIFAFAIALGVWLQWGKKRGCPPTRCDWLAIGWTMALTGLSVVFFVLNCLSSWIPWAIVFFLLFAYLAFLWFRSCAVNKRPQVLFTFLLLALIAAAIDMILIARPILGECCAY